jgi:peptidoglycan-N-acetylglucosamine deacetylase
VRIFTKPNGGKSSALNFGFAHTDADVIVALDADTIFDPHTIGWLAARFVNPKIGAVAGNAKVGNRINLLTRWQATEYITSQNLDRRAFELLNCVTVVPGAVGAWRREAVIALGGYTSDTLAEDADLTIRLLRAGYKVAYEERAIALTEAPETTRELFKQRFRWMFGMLQTTFKHRDALLMRDSKSVAFIALPHILVFQIMFSLVAPIADIVALIALGDLVVKIATESSLMSAGQIFIFLALFFSFVILDFMTGVMAFRLEKDEDWRLLLWVPLQRFYYRQLLYIVALKALLTAMRGSLVGWGNLARTASVKFDASSSVGGRIKAPPG